MDSLEIEMPFPPSLNAYYRNTSRGVLISSQGRAYRARVQAHLLSQRLNSQGVTLPFTVPVGITIMVFAVDHRRRDLDNLLKATLDALTHNKIWHDDSLVDYLEIERRHKTDEPKLLVRVWAID